MDAIRHSSIEGKFFATVQEVQSSGTPEQIAAAFHTLIRDLYWKSHDLPAVVSLGRAGILYCLAMQLRSNAKALAYDVGSFTWPGWEEPGIDPTDADLRFGRECARFNLELAIELKKPVEKIALADWLVGAHALTAAEPDVALPEFQRGAELLTDLQEHAALRHFLLGYAAVARLHAGVNITDAQETLDQEVSCLQEIGSDDAKSFHEQLLIAHRRFVSG